MVALTRLALSLPPAPPSPSAVPVQALSPGPVAVSAAAPPSSPAYPCLVADIGGTNARFAWLAHPGAAPEHLQTLSVPAHAGPAEAARAYLSTLAPLLGPAAKAPRTAAFAVATAVSGDRVAFTNSPWDFSREAVRTALGLDALAIVNDFEALALSLPHLRPSQWQAVGVRPHEALADGKVGTVAAVLGPGTGLGVGAVVRTRAGWQALPGEGGHATLAATDPLESEVIALVRARFTHVSAERLLSGIGLPVLHAALAQVRGRPRPDEASARAIVDAAGAGGDADAQATLDLFCALLGSFAGNVALTLGARGGVYIGGGIVPRFAERFAASPFRQRFEAKGRFEPYLSKVPTMLITDTQAALTGAALAMAGT